MLSGKLDEYTTDHKGLAQANIQVLKGQGKGVEVVSMGLAAETVHLFCFIPFCISLPYGYILYNGRSVGKGLFS